MKGPVDMPLYQHRFQGNLASGDIFSFSWWSDNGLTIDASHGNAVTWVTDLWNGTATGAGFGALCVPGVEVNRVTTGEITTATGQQQTLRESTVSLPGAATASALPADVAIVVSLRSPLANRSGRGRFYLPQPAVTTVTASGRLAAGPQGDIVTTLSEAWATANGAGESPVVYSRTRRQVVPITSFNIGDLFDTQRRRENALSESRQTADMP